MKTFDPLTDHNVRVKFYTFLYNSGWARDNSMLLKIVAHKHLTQKDYELITGEKFPSINKREKKSQK